MALMCCTGKEKDIYSGNCLCALFIYMKTLCKLVWWCHDISWNVTKCHHVKLKDFLWSLVIYHIRNHQKIFNLIWWHFMTYSDIDGFLWQNHMVYHDNNNIVSWYVMIFDDMICNQPIRRVFNRSSYNSLFRVMGVGDRGSGVGRGTLHVHAFYM